MGTTHGFTQRGSTGVMVPVEPLPTFPESEGLKASAVALALTLLPVFPQIREKNVGSLGRVTCTVTIGLTVNAAGSVEQSLLEMPPAA